MSSVQALLARLQDPQTAGKSCCATLTELLALCRDHKPRQLLLQSDALDALAAFAAAIISEPAAELAHALLELLAALVCDRDHHDSAAVERLARRPPLLVLPLRCLRALAAKKPSTKRARHLRITLGLLQQLSATTDGQREAHQRQMVAALLRVLENAQDDAALLQMATETLRSAMATHRSNVHVTASLNAVGILLHLLDTLSDSMELKRSVLAALLEVACEPELVPIIAANKAVTSLARCLRLRAHHCHIQTSALELLLLLCRDSQVMCQVINEDVISVLFQVLARHDTTNEATAAAVKVLEGVAVFALSSKLDLAAFVNSSVACRGPVVVQAVATHSRESGLIVRAFRFFATIVRNPTALPGLINGETLEGLLELYMGSTSACELGELLSATIASMSRSTIESLVLQNDDQSLPALFLCLRRHRSDAPFVVNTFALVTRHGGSKSLTTSAQGWTGFVGIAVEMLLLRCSSDSEHCRLAELVDLLYFLRNTLLVHDGGDVVLACGGLALSRALAVRFPIRAARDAKQAALEPSSECLSLTSADAPAVESMARIVAEMLHRAIAAAGSRSKAPTTGSSGQVTSRNEPCAGAVQVSHTLPSLQSLSRGMSDTLVGSEHGAREAADPGEEDDDDLNDDGSDSDDDEEESALYDLKPSRRVMCDEPLDDPLEVEAEDDRFGVDSSEHKQRNPLAPLHADFATAALRPVDFSSLHEQAFCYVDDLSGIQYPKHPARSATVRPDPRGAEGSVRVDTATIADGFDLLHEPPAQPEPCKPPEPAAMACFVEQASRRRDQFVAADPDSRARIIYENTAVLCTDNRTTKRGTEGVDDDVEDHIMDHVAVHNTSAYPYHVPWTSRAFAASSALTFDSWFESGNLERAIQIDECEYDLVLRRDLHTAGHTQWFYFAVSNLPVLADKDTGSARRRKFRFNIINLCKPDSLFNQGLQPVVYSVRDASERRIGWRRAGQDVYYFPNPFARTGACVVGNPTNSSGSRPAEMASCGSGPAKAQTFYTLTFTLELTNANDTYLVAHNYPFTYSDHQRHLQRILHQPRASRRQRVVPVVRHSVLCSTLQGRPCDLLTISDFSASTQELAARRAVFLTARVHPGETQASWIMRGAVDFLVGGSETARVLRRLFVFHVVPMLNPDGVFHGNSRCSLSASDLNRQWRAPSPQLHPTIFHLKQLLRSESAARGIVLFGDIHGHSRKKNVFLYGCDTKKKPNPRARHFAKLLATQPSARRFVSFADCSFKVSRDKETTARVVLTKELQLSWCFTLEASFSGASFGELRDVHFDTTHFQQVGSGFCETLLPACITDVRLRDKIALLVDDHTVSIAALVDAQLLDAGIVSRDASLFQTGAVAQKSMPRKDKASVVGANAPPGEASSKNDPTTSALNARRRRTLVVLSGEAAAATTSATTPRQAPPKRLPTAVARRKSSPAKIAAPAAAASTRSSAEAGAVWKKTAEPPVAHMRRRHSSVRIPDEEEVSATTTSGRQRPLLELLGTFVPSDEEDTQLYKLQTLVRQASSSLRSSSSVLSATPDPPPRSCPPPSDTFLSRRRIMATSAARARATDDPTASPCRVSATDAVPVLLPPPVSDVRQLRSPSKLPSSSLHFKGAGRQYAALQAPPSSKPPTRPTELVRSGSTPLSASGYEPQLLNASTISLRHRSSASISSPSAASAGGTEQTLATAGRPAKIPSSSSL